MSIVLELLYIMRIVIKLWKPLVGVVLSYHGQYEKKVGLLTVNIKSKKTRQCQGKDGFRRRRPHQKLTLKLYLATGAGAATAEE